MPDPLDLEAIRGHIRDAIQDGSEESLYGCVYDAKAMLAEIDRLRTIAGPLERLEAWRYDEDHIFELWEVVDDDGNAMIRVELTDSNRDRLATDVGTLLYTAIAAALDAWHAKYGKDGP